MMVSTIFSECVVRGGWRALLWLRVVFVQFYHTIRFVNAKYLKAVGLKPCCNYLEEGEKSLKV